MTEFCEHGMPKTPGIEGGPVPYCMCCDCEFTTKAADQARREALREAAEVVRKWTRGDARPNLWLGVTAENQARADERIPLLLQIPAAHRFVSVEPMLGPVNLERNAKPWGDGGASARWLAMLSWVICGPETGPKARPCKPEWIADLHAQCKAAGVPFWDKRKNPIAREKP